MERLKAFSDGVIAIILTIMVLELRAPEEAEPAALQPLLPVVLSYLISFFSVGVYWLNHRRHLQIAIRGSHAVQWWNLILLFWLSLFPFCTDWMNENHYEPWPVALFGVINLVTGLFNSILVHALVKANGPDSPIAHALTRERPRAMATVAMYAAGIGLSFVQPMLGFACYLLAVCLWAIPLTEAAEE